MENGKQKLKYLKANKNEDMSYNFSYVQNIETKQINR